MELRRLTDAAVVCAVSGLIAAIVPTADRIDAADDARYGDWAPSNMAAMSHLATGISLADENLARRSATFITEPNMARLDQVRAAYDPSGMFHTWMASG